VSVCGVCGVWAHDSARVLLCGSTISHPNMPRPHPANQNREGERRWEKRPGEAGGRDKWECGVRVCVCVKRVDCAPTVSSAIHITSHQIQRCPKGGLGTRRSASLPHQTQVRVMNAAGSWWSLPHLVHTSHSYPPPSLHCGGKATASPHSHHTLTLTLTHSHAHRPTHHAFHIKA
jgi:hypothetical protein